MPLSGSPVRAERCVVGRCPSREDEADDGALRGGDGTDAAGGGGGRQWHGARSADSAARRYSRRREAMSRADPEHLDRLIRQCAEGEKEAYDSAAALQDHTDKMLTWLLGLMGAGLIAGMPLLKNTPAAGRFCPVRALARGNRRRARRPHHSPVLRGSESLWHFD